MTVVFDLATPKQVTFFPPMIDRLRGLGGKVRVVTRRQAELDVLIESSVIRAKAFGSYGGATLIGKLRGSAERVRLLADYFHRTAPDALVSLSNADSIRAAYGLGIPVVCFNDLPESKPVGRLALPLASVVCAPWIVPRRTFAEYGVPRERVFQYRSLDPVCWLDRYDVNPGYREQLGIDPARPLLVCRETESQSAYVRRDIVGEVVRELKRRHADWQVVDIPRYRAHRPYDTASLLCVADAFVGGGGTMCIEAAYFGTPVIATRGFITPYMTWLFRKALARECLTARDAVREVERIVEKRYSAETRIERRRARRIFSGIPFPLDEVVRLIMDCAGKSRV